MIVFITLVVVITNISLTKISEEETRKKMEERQYWKT